MRRQEACNHIAAVIFPISLSISNKELLLRIFLTPAPTLGDIKHCLTCIDPNTPRNSGYSDPATEVYNLGKLLPGYSLEDGSSNIRILVLVLVNLPQGPRHQGSVKEAVVPEVVDSGVIPIWNIRGRKTVLIF